MNYVEASVVVGLNIAVIEGEISTVVAVEAVGKNRFESSVCPGAAEEEAAVQVVHFSYATTCFFREVEDRGCCGECLEPIECYAI